MAMGTYLQAKTEDPRLLAMHDLSPPTTPRPRPEKRLSMATFLVKEHRELTRPVSPGFGFPWLPWLPWLEAIASRFPLRLGSACLLKNIRREQQQRSLQLFRLNGVRVPCKVPESAPRCRRCKLGRCVRIRSTRIWKNFERSFLCLYRDYVQGGAVCVSGTKYIQHYRSIKPARCHTVSWNISCEANILGWQEATRSRGHRY